MRREFFTSDNAVFALYGLLDTIEATAKAEGRPLTEQERAIVILTQRKTHAMFESVCRLGENYTQKKPYRAFARASPMDAGGASRGR